MLSPRLDVKLVKVAGRHYFCTVLPYIPPTPVQELDLGWPKQPSTGYVAQPNKAYIDPWDYVNTKMDLMG